MQRAPTSCAAVHLANPLAMRHHSSIESRSDIRKVVFSDLDGTLLDHDTYDWQPAAPALQALKARGIPVVLVSSKTLAELEVHRRAMALPDPVVAENGAAIDVPDGYFPGIGSVDFTSIDREALRRHLDAIREEGDYDCLSFAELGEDGIAQATGLTAEQAVLANRRRASEPLLWRDSEERLSAFVAAVEARGLRCTRGGRFVHLTGPVDKADAVAELCRAYRRKWPDAMLQSVALGDGPNDLGMLRAADVAVVIRGRHGRPMPMEGHAHVLRPAKPGPAGWAEAMQTLLD
jgi:mannosyl-3-phosphoglycerate phosphatase